MGWSTRVYIQVCSRAPSASNSFKCQRAPPKLSPAASPIPTRLNNIPHERSTRQHFYTEVSTAVEAALADGALRLSVRCTIPELNTEFDVYRVGTMLELVRELAVMACKDGKRVKVSVQQALGQGVFQGTPLSLSGVTRIMGQMDWGAATDFIQLGNLGAGEVEGADVLILIAPQNVTGHSVLPLLEETAAAAGAAGKPMILINPKLGDIPASGGVMGVRGREERTNFVDTFLPAYHFRLLYLSAAAYPIMGALRYSWKGPWEVFRRVDTVDGEGARAEAYQVAGEFEAQPNASQITECFQKKK